VELSHVRVSSSTRRSEAMAACSPLSSNGGKKQDLKKGIGGSFTNEKQQIWGDHRVVVVALVCGLCDIPTLSKGGQF
jgi:hypothetical protein